MKILIIVLLMVTGCASYPTTSFTYKNTDGSSVEVKMPKEMTAKNLTVEINATSGIATVKADEMKTTSANIIAESGIVQQQNLKAASEIANQAAQGAAQGAMKSILPIP